MNEWITDRLPTNEDAVSTNVLIWLNDKVHTWTYYTVAKGTPWQPIHKPAPYVEPMRWTVESVNGYWRLRYLGVEMMTLTTLDWHHAEAAQRIADIYNKVKPCR
jgi:hypothetical protein